MGRVVDGTDELCGDGAQRDGGKRGERGTPGASQRRGAAQHGKQRPARHDAQSRNFDQAGRSETAGPAPVARDHHRSSTRRRAQAPRLRRPRAARLAAAASARRPGRSARTRQPPRAGPCRASPPQALRTSVGRSPVRTSTRGPMTRMPSAVIGIAAAVHRASRTDGPGSGRTGPADARQLHDELVSPHARGLPAGASTRDSRDARSLSRPTRSCSGDLPLHARTDPGTSTLQ